MRSLGDLCEIIGGGTPAKSKAEYYSGTIPWATVRDMWSEVITDTERKITTRAVAHSSTNIIPAGNVVIATRVGLGKVCLLGQDTAINQDLRGIVPIDLNTLSVRFLYWWLKSTTNLIIAEGTGATVQGVKLPFIRALQVPLPPLPDQQRIVGVLDEAFAGIASAKANAKKNLTNARALYESQLHSVMASHGAGWGQTTLGSVCEFRGGGTPSKSIRRYWNGTIPWVSPKDMKAEVVLDSIDHISPEAVKGSATSLIPQGAVLVVVRSGILARVVPIAVAGRELTINQDLKALVPNDAIESRFLYCLMESMMPKLLSLVSRGATVHRLSTDEIRRLSFRLPPLAEQQRIASRLDACRREALRLADLYHRKLTELDSLKASLLHSAFSGSL